MWISKLHEDYVFYTIQIYIIVQIKHSVRSFNKDWTYFSYYFLELWNKLDILNCKFVTFLRRKKVCLLLLRIIVKSTNINKPVLLRYLRINFLFHKNKGEWQKYSKDRRIFYILWLIKYFFFSLYSNNYVDCRIIILLSGLAMWN